GPAASRRARSSAAFIPRSSGPSSRRWPRVHASRRSSSGARKPLSDATAQHRNGGAEMTIGISGAGGQLGRATTDLLLDRAPPSELVLVTRDPAQLQGYADRGAAVRHGDYREPGTLRDAYGGVDPLLLISGADIGQRT